MVDTQNSSKSHGAWTWGYRSAQHNGWTCLHTLSTCYGKASLVVHGTTKGKPSRRAYFVPKTSTTQTCCGDKGNLFIGMVWCRYLETNMGVFQQLTLNGYLLSSCYFQKWFVVLFLVGIPKKTWEVRLGK